MYSRVGPDAVQHLFGVSGGLDSMIVGRVPDTRAGARRAQRGYPKRKSARMTCVGLFHRAPASGQGVCAKRRTSGRNPLSISLRRRASRSSAYWATCPASAPCLSARAKPGSLVARRRSPHRGHRRPHDCQPHREQGERACRLSQQQGRPVPRFGRRLASRGHRNSRDRLA